MKSDLIRQGFDLSGFPVTMQDWELYPGAMAEPGGCQQGPWPPSSSKFFSALCVVTIPQCIHAVQGEKTHKFKEKDS